MNKIDDEAEDIYHFDDWVRYMFDHSDYSEDEIMEFEEYYQDTLDFNDNTDNFLYLKKFRIGLKII